MRSLTNPRYPDDALELTGSYFDNTLQLGEVAYEKYFSEDERNEFPKCLLRYWTMGEIITFLLQQVLLYLNLSKDRDLILTKMFRVSLHW